MKRTCVNYCSKKDALVRDCMREEGPDIQFNRSFGAHEVAEWEELGDTLRDVILCPGKDKPIWTLEKNGCYSTKSMYRFFTFRGVLSKRLDKLWKSKLPMKLKIFMWLAMHERLQTGVALKKKKWKGEAHCNLCNCPEMVDHFLFQCILPKFVWACFKEILGWDQVPQNLFHMLDHWIPLGCPEYDLKFFAFVIVAWALWVTRNKIRLQQLFPRSPTSVLFKSASFMQRWSVLLREADKGKLRTQAGVLRVWAATFEDSRTQEEGDVWS